MNNNFYVFENALTEALKERMGEDIKLDIHETIKNNQVTYHALAIMKEDTNISPNIRLDDFFEAYKNGTQIGEISNEIIAVYEKAQKHNIDISLFTDFSLAKENIYFKIVGFEPNKKRLQKMPHKRFLDLAITYYFHMDSEEFCGQNASIQIDYSHLKLWNIDEEELHKIALRNAVENMPYELKSMSDIICGMLCDNSEAVYEAESMREDINKMSEVAPMYVLSNTMNFYGAACIYYPGVLKFISNTFGRNLLILPSSVHEVIIIPEFGSENYENINSMIQEINTEQVAEEEVLSNHLYYYDSSTDEVICPSFSMVYSG